MKQNKPRARISAYEAATKPKVYASPLTSTPVKQESAIPKTPKSSNPSEHLQKSVNSQVDPAMAQVIKTITQTPWTKIFIAGLVASLTKLGLSSQALTDYSVSGLAIMRYESKGVINLVNKSTVALGPMQVTARNIKSLRTKNQFKALVDLDSIKMATKRFLPSLLKDLSDVKFGSDDTAVTDPKSLTHSVVNTESGPYELIAPTISLFVSVVKTTRAYFKWDPVLKKMVNIKKMNAENYQAMYDMGFAKVEQDRGAASCFLMTCGWVMGEPFFTNLTVSPYLDNHPTRPLMDASLGKLLLSPSNRSIMAEYINQISTSAIKAS